MSRLLTSAIAVCLGITVANAQTSSIQLNNARATLVPALTTFGNLQEVTLSIAGTLTQNGNTAAIQSSWAISRVPVNGVLTTRIEYFRQHNSQMEERIVADGQRLWIYNFVRHEYTVFEYNNGRPGLDRRLLLALRKRAKGYDNIILHALIDAEEAARDPLRLSGPSGWNPYNTNAQITTDPTGVETVSTTPRYTYVKYNISFDVNTLISRLQSIRGYQEEPNNAGLITFDWTATVWENALPSTTSFVFNPGTAKAVSINLAQGG